MKHDTAYFLGLAKVVLSCNQVMHPRDKKREPFNERLYGTMLTD